MQQPYDNPCRKCWSPFRRCRDCLIQAQMDVDQARERYITDYEKRQQVEIEMKRMVQAKLNLINETVRRGRNHMKKTLKGLIAQYSDSRHPLSVPPQIPQGIYSSESDGARQIQALVEHYEKQIEAANLDASSSEDMFRSHMIRYNALVNRMPERRRKKLGAKEKASQEEVRHITNQMAPTKPPNAIITDEIASILFSIDDDRLSPSRQKLAKNNSAVSSS